MAPGLPSIIDIAERFDQYAYSCSKFNLSQVTSYLVYRRNAILPVLDYAGCDYAKLLQDCQDQALRVRRLRYETRRLLMLAAMEISQGVTSYLPRVREELPGLAQSARDEPGNLTWTTKFTLGIYTFKVSITELERLVDAACTILEGHHLELSTFQAQNTLESAIDICGIRSEGVPKTEVVDRLVAVYRDFARPFGEETALIAANDPFGFFITALRHALKIFAHIRLRCESLYNASAANPRHVPDFAEQLLKSLSNDYFPLLEAMFTSPEPMNETRRPEPFSHYSGVLKTTEWVDKDSITSRNTFTAPIEFEPAFAGAPMFLYGVTMLNADCPSVYLHNVGAPAFGSGAQLTMGARGESNRIREAEFNWMAVDPDLNLQTGCASLGRKSMDNPIILDGSDAKVEGVATQPIRFARPYKKIPRVLCSFSMFDLGAATGRGGSISYHIKTYPSNITAEGFDLKVAAWNGGGWESIGVTWVAYDPASPAIAGGVTRSDKQGPTSRPLKWDTDWRTTINFEPHFERTPQIFLGFNYLNVGYRSTLDQRFMLRLHCCNIGDKKAVIRVSTQSRTMLCHVGFTWLVVDQTIKADIEEEEDTRFFQAQQSSEYGGYCNNDDIEQYIDTHLTLNHR